LLENKSLKVVGVLTGDRSSAFPDVPTAQEQGVDLVFPVWRGVFTAAGAPKANVEKLASAIQTAMQAPKFQEFVKTSGITPKFLGPDAFAKLVASEDALYSELLEDLGLKVSSPK
jgi:putative tricarboxylic transport membrane protein